MKKSTIIKAISLISDEHVAEFANVAPTPRKKLRYVKSNAVLAAGIIVVLCTMPIVYNTSKNRNIVTETPSVSSSYNSETMADVIVSVQQDSSESLSDRTESTSTSAALTDNDKKEVRTASNQVKESSEHTSKKSTSSSNTNNSQNDTEHVSEVEFQEQPIENNNSDYLDEPTDDTSAQITESHILEEDPSSDNSELVVEQDSDADYLPEENNVDDFDVETIGVVVYDGRIYYQDLSKYQNDTDTEKLKALLGDYLGSTIYKNSDWWIGKSPNDVLEENYISSFDGKIYSLKGKRKEEDIAVIIHNENDEIIVFLKS